MFNLSAHLGTILPTFMYMYMYAVPYLWISYNIGN